MNLQQLMGSSPAPNTLLKQIRKSPSAQVVLNGLRAAIPTLPGSAAEIPQTTYSLYRQFVHSGERAGYEERYFAKRSMLTRAVVEMLVDDKSMMSIIHDLLWSICEETSWVLPAHEDPDPDYIDLFAAETGAALAEAVYLLGDQLAVEVVQRVRQEVERRILCPYLTYGRKYWWHTGNLNWNAVCNGAIGLSFMRLEDDPRRLAEAITLVLEGFDAYLATGFEADGGSLEGIGYWNYGLLYYVVVAELLRERTDGRLDLLANPRLAQIARFPIVMSLAPGTYLNFGDAHERAELQPGIVQRLAERTGLAELKGLIDPLKYHEKEGSATARLAIAVRDIAWWDGQQQPFPTDAHEDVYLPDCAIIKLTSRTAQGQPVILAAKAGRNDGHHYHTDIGHFIVNVGGESLLCDPGRGLYSRDYFNERRFQNIFCNSFGHSVPRIDGQMQMTGPKFGGDRLVEGKIVHHGRVADEKFAEIDFTPLYDVPELTIARRKLRMASQRGEIWLEDTFECSGNPLDIEEAFVTWHAVSIDSSFARIESQQSALTLAIQEPAGLTFCATRLELECQANQREGILTRLKVDLPPGTKRFVLHLVPTAVSPSS